MMRTSHRAALALVLALGLLLPACTDTTTVAWPDDAVLSGVSPASGPLQGGSTVTVWGFGFRSGASVLFGGVPASDVTVVGPTRIECVTPPGAAGYADVAVENPGGRTSLLASAWEYTTWVDTDWTRRKALTLSGSSGVLAAFQVRVALDHDPDMRPDFGDVRFAWSDGLAEQSVPFWTESYETAASAVFWVRVPVIETAGTTLYAYYGNPSAVSASSFGQTFDKDYGDGGLLGLWLLDEGAGLGASDASSQGRHGVLENFVAPAGWLGFDGATWAGRQDVRFPAGDALLFDGVDDRVDAGSDPGLSPASALSMEAWVRADTTSAMGGEQVIASRWRSFGAGFEDVTRWKAFDPGRGVQGFDTLGYDPDGFHCGAFDGRYLYFGQYNNGSTYAGEILRFDTHGAFDSHGSWAIFDPGDEGVGTDPDGFTSAAFDGRYVYFSQYYNGSRYSAEVLRYDTQAPFADASSWASFNLEEAGSAVWSAAAALPTQRAYARAVELGGQIYVVGGIGPVADNTEYDPSTDTWQDLTPMGTPRNGPGVAALGGRIYAFGGQDASVLSTGESYDPSADSWAATQPMMQARQGGLALPLGGRIYVLGGHDGVSALSSCEVYDPASDTWAAVASMPAPRWWAGGAVYGDRLYVFGGSDAAQVADVWSYHPVTDTWRVQASMPTASHGHACQVVGDRIYALGGYNGSYLAANQVYDPAEDTWTAGTPLTGVREHLCSAVCQGRIYAFGGFDGSSNLTTAEIYDPAQETPMERNGGYEGMVFDGRHLYFVPYYDGSRHGEFLRYDTQADFGARSSWQVFYPGRHGVGDPDKGLYGACFDGRYLYFPPYYSDALSHTGEVTRYDTRGSFRSAESWTVYDPGAEGLDALGFDPDGYIGCAFDGRYVYFSPYAANTGQYSGEVLRYDTHRDFRTLSSWKAFDPGSNGVGSDPDGFRGGLFDGRYVHFCPYYNGSSHTAETLRYDTAAPFDLASSWSAYNPFTETAQHYENGGYIGFLSDGRYHYYVAHHDGGHHGEFLRYDASAHEGAYKLLWSRSSFSGSQCGGPFGLSAFLCTDAGAFSVSANRVHEPGAWIHVAMTYDGSELRLYADGALAASTPASGNVVPSTAPLRIGSNGDGRGCFRGAVDEVRIYDRGLPADEVLAHSQRRKYASPAPAVTAVGEEERR